MDSDWSNLPLLVVIPILDKLLEPIDHVRFAQVCKGWSSHANDYKRFTQRRRSYTPMFMIPEATDIEDESSSNANVVDVQTNQTSRLQLYSFSEGRLNNYIRTFELPIPYTSSTTRHYCGCGHGWLASIDVTEKYGNQLSITLISPFYPTTHNKICLPLLEFYPNVGKGINSRRVPNVLSSADPVSNPHDYVVIAFYTNYDRLAFLKGGQGSWTPILCVDESWDEYYYPKICDVFLYKGQFYVLDSNAGWIASFQVNSTTTLDDPNSDIEKVVWVNEVYDGKDLHRSTRSYIVESTKGHLWIVKRTFDHEVSSEWLQNAKITYQDENVTTYDSTDLESYETFKVYKLLLDDQGCCVKLVEEVQSIEDEVIFVGDNNSVCVLASTIPGCQRNSLYFTDDTVRHGWDLAGGFPDKSWQPEWAMGIFDLDRKTITSLLHEQKPWDKDMPRAIWIAPPPFNYSSSIESADR